MKRTTYRTKYNAIRAAKTGRRVYRVKGGYRVSPECPRAGARRRALIRQRRKTRRMRPRKSLAAIILDALPF